MGLGRIGLWLAAAFALAGPPLAAGPRAKAPALDCPVRHTQFHGDQPLRPLRQDYEVKPALWKVADADTTIHIFGTFHVLPQGFRWRTPLFDKVVADADEAVFESRDDSLAVPEGETPPEDQRYLDLIAAHPAKVALSKRISAHNRAKLARLYTLAGIAPEEMERLPPLLAMFTIADIDSVAAGSSGTFGVETVLEKEFRGSGRPVGAIEDPVAVMESLLAIDEGEVAAMIDAGLEGWDGCALAGPQETDWSSEHAWARGKIAAEDIATMKDEPFEAAFYEAIIVRRNRAWAEWLASRMDKPGKVLLAVGAAHMEGPDSLLPMLEAKGLKVERVQ